MQLLDGKLTSQQITSEIKNEVILLKEKTGKVPGLVTILVGDNPASKVYVSSKHKGCEEVGFLSISEKLPVDISQNQLLDVIYQYNENHTINGILVQLPLPKHIDENKVIEAILPSKDVDGFHPMNVGNLVIGRECFKSCTPAGIQELLKRYKIETSGKHVVVVGRSNIVGKPIANIMLQKQEFANSIVTVCHTAAKDLSYYTKQADILIAAIGKPKVITADMVKDGAVVIDVGINSVEDNNTEKGYKLVGDVDFDNVAPKCAYITPVPGGVGPMTIAMLLQNTLLSFKKANNLI
ncbi:MAG TPA: bifunctional methylenetetrahydrofolate dehydrogenase/methenyltetrahydrofolate cyclohydrolase FolD [Ignavibacteriales bacterium]|nr:bifunctional methylenetetrahydrofolate dehydrogenase/methenyltetrahydrofolate cyclohydrolase FolD [Ignavibacteriales bacterium]HOL81512.1 bifunctional methylenetetrahydrofolate dehydrogenase/methenyltetrahydrofolate cyclohydrolase FolD [Ignavibacteriales bacterium]HOM65410.1 bifunctional methylenetetrahydrofolate dehydrogenase/methenyltetrahydrofolate cyclohydrolase FolD [Ignavibacteriales bacterium]HPP33561.1 bifunctional methylenetetrahydrofolate dehydrogenase/methenyltetrahydrofolate cyclo